MTRSERLLGAALAAIVASGCDLDDRTLTVRSTVIPLLPDITGYVNGRNQAGIRGSWDAFADTPDCTALGFSPDQCSKIQTTVPVPTDLATGKMCASGTAAQVLPDPKTMQLVYASIWGAGIEIDLNNNGVDDPYDARAHGITGISFEIDSPPAMQVDFPVAGRSRANIPLWGGATANVSPVTPGLNIVRWADVGGPPYAPAGLVFDERQLLRIQFTVPANMDHATPFSFCVSNLAARSD